MTEKIARRGVKTPHSFESDMLERITVEQVINDNGIVISEENSIKEVREWLNKEQNMESNYFIVSNNAGEYKGVLSSLSLLIDNYNPDEKIVTLLKEHHVSIQLNDTLRNAAETMAKENIDVLPVISGKNKNIVGLVSYHDILATYKYGIDEHEMKRPHISLKRNGLKILLQGQKLIELTKRKSKSIS